ncbi:MAG: hypothetical protein CMM47_03215 [Rhodospirillaceae bacterium]|nr:hypothetical protein [Rhodospirillaceae bacterium]
MSNELPVIDHAGVLEDVNGIPGWVTAEPAGGTIGTPYSCSFCGVGDNGFLQSMRSGTTELSSDFGGENTHYAGGTSITERSVKQIVPTGGCVKLKLSMASQRPAFPIHIAPSVREIDGSRRTISYHEAIERFAALQLAHRGNLGRTLFYACGQIDYFSIFAIQEVFRLLGVRNLTGNAEHCLNAGAVHNEILTGQEGPFLTIDQSITGTDRFFLFNGWNGLVTHPPVYRAIAKREDLDAYLIEVAVTETAIDLAKKLGPERVLLIKPRSDPHLALSVAHELLDVHGDAIESRFIEHFSDIDSFEQFSAFARQSRFEPRYVASRIAPEEGYEERLENGIRLIAQKLANQRTVPINIPSVGLSQSSGVVAHCLWGSALGMLGKYGLKPDGQPAGGTLRVPGQINAESEVQGLSRKYYMGRIPIEETAEAARRMGLPENAYQGVIEDEPRAALDYAQSVLDTDELFVFMGTQFEANMMDRRRWIAKLKDPRCRIVVIDPIPDPFTLEFADLIIPAPPHIASTKLYQNGEWKLSLSVPGKHAPPETRSDATIIYDMMAAITRLLKSDESQREDHPDLASHLTSGYLEGRFGAGLRRINGEVDRDQLWRRVQDYMAGGRGPLYCRPEHSNGKPIEWRELVEEGAVIYGGVGVKRYTLDYDKPDQRPFADIFREPRDFSFFVPTEDDLHIPHGMILNSGRSSMSSDRKAIQFATASFNSGKATPLVNMPDENPCHISPFLARKLGIVEGDRIRITGRGNGATIDFPAVITDRVKGETAYVSFHKNRAQIEDGVYVNDVTTAVERCSYCSQTSVKSSLVLFERVPAARHKPDGLATPTIVSGLRGSGQGLDTTQIDTRTELPIWSGQDTPLYVNEIIQETHDVYTFRLQGDPLCRFNYLPGQFCSLVLNIDGKKVVRSYTISSTPTRPYILEITIKRVPDGLVSNWLPDNLKTGDRIEAAGPKGKFHLVPGAIPKKVLFLGAGSGITPVMSMSRWLCDVAADVDIQLFNSVRSPDDIIFAKEFDYMVERYRMFTSAQISGTRGSRGDWQGLAGHISRPALELVSPDLMEREVFMCGPQGFMGVTRDILDEMGFDLAKLHSESFGGVRTSVAEKLGPVGGDPGDVEVTQAGNFTIEFAGAGVKAKTDGGVSVLDIAESHDIDLDYGCRTGSCGDCKVKLISGDVDWNTQEGLTPDECQDGYILTCVTRPKGDCVIDA